MQQTSCLTKQLVSDCSSLQQQLATYQQTLVVGRELLLCLHLLPTSAFNSQSQHLPVVLSILAFRPIARHCAPSSSTRTCSAEDNQVRHNSNHIPLDRLSHHCDRIDWLISLPRTAKLASKENMQDTITDVEMFCIAAATATINTPPLLLLTK